MKKSNFVMSIEFSDGTVSEMYNCCGLKESTIDAAIADGTRIFIKNYDVNRLHNSKRIAAYWENAKVHSVRYDVTDSNNLFSHRETHTIQYS